MNTQLKQWLSSIPGIMDLRAVLRARQAGAHNFLWHAPPGHFYSALPSRDDVLRALSAASDDLVPDVEMAESAQLAWWQRIATHLPRLQFPEQQSHDFRFHYGNPYFGHGDAEILFATLCELKPQVIVEVGSGFSSAMMLDTDDRELGGKTQFVFIEPYPDRLNGLLRGSDRARTEIIQRPVQSVSPTVFSRLKAGDLLFIDSSHVAKAGSDVLHLLFRVWPALSPGVIVHIHDIFWPFEYPQEWLKEGRSWNEAYFVRAFLAGNTGANILFMNSWFAAKHSAKFHQALPLATSGSSLWLHKG